MIDFSKIKTFPLKERKNKVSIRDFAKVGAGVLPIKNNDITELATRIVNAFNNKKQVIFMFGGHSIKTGISPYYIDLMKRGIITHIATNGSASIHDFEIALIGETSEDVQENIETGKFGMWEETGRLMNEAINNTDKGYGYSIGRKIDELDCKFKEHSVFYWAYKLNIPITVHVAIGNDIIHQHPSCDGAKLGKATYSDFKTFVESISRLDNGVILNIGSAVILPEVFLKAITIARNLGFKINEFTAANLDMIDHYRPRVNVVERPTSLGGRGFSIIGKIEETIPTLHYYVIDKIR